MSLVTFFRSFDVKIFQFQAKITWVWILDEGPKKFEKLGITMGNPCKKIRNSQTDLLQASDFFSPFLSGKGRAMEMAALAATNLLQDTGSGFVTT